MNPGPRSGYRLSVCLLAALVLAGCSGSATPATSTLAPTAPPAAVTAPVPAGEVILTTGEWPPYVSEAMDGYGPLTAIVAAAFQEMGIVPRYDFYPWKRAEDEVRAGRAFAAFPYTQTDARKGEFDFSDVLYTVKAKFFYMKSAHPNGIPFDKLEDLRGYRIGGLLGSWYDKQFAEAGLQVEYAADMEQTFQKLYLGRIDLAIEAEATCWAVIKKLYPDEVDKFGTLEKPLVDPANPNELRLMVSRDYPKAAALMQQFNAALQTIKDNGTYQQILDQYGLK
jgi:polar amino acid transport system substrate-binding protein